MIMLISLLLSFSLGVTLGVVSSIITGISIPVITIILVNIGLANHFPVPCLLFLITASITNQLLQTITAHKSTILSLDTELSELKVNKTRPNNNLEFVEQTLELGQSIRQTLHAKINGMRLGYLAFGVPLIFLGALLPKDILSTLIGGFSYLSVPLLCISIAVLAVKNLKLGVFISIGGALAWLVLNSPKMATAPSSAPIMLLFSCALVIQNLGRREEKNTLPMKWLESKYTPKLNWYLSLLKPIDWLYAITGGALAGMSPSFVKAITNVESNKKDLSTANQLNQIQTQSISEMLSLFLVLVGAGNSRTSLSAEAYAILPEAGPWIAIATVLLIEIIIRLVASNTHFFINLVQNMRINPITHVLLPNITLLTIALGPTVAIPGILVSVTIGLIHKQLGLPASQFITVLSLPTLLILSPLNSLLTRLVF